MFGNIYRTYSQIEVIDCIMLGAGSWTMPKIDQYLSGTITFMIVVGPVPCGPHTAPQERSNILETNYKMTLGQAFCQEGHIYDPIMVVEVSRM